jgi:cytochrome c oxidase subunit II
MRYRLRHGYSSFCFALPPLAAHSATQSVLQPAGEDASRIAELSWLLFAAGSVIFLVVLAFTIAAMVGSPALRSALRHPAVIVGGGIAFPVLALSALLLYTFHAAAGMGRKETEAASIEVIGELWWWRVRYLDSSGRMLFETANEIRIPARQSIVLRLTSKDVIHSFWVPELAGKIDLIPGHITHLRLHADAAGVFRGQCAEYCGGQHTNMAIHVIAENEDAHQRWHASQLPPAAVSTDALTLRGQQLFVANRCGQCHAIRGTSANGTLGPDLTHLGSRHMIGAGMLPNGAGNIAAWIVGSQHIKPGNRMPAFRQFSGEELRALAVYLEGLK